MARNKYAGNCYACGKWVEPGYGHFELIRGTHPAQWRIKCVKCASGRTVTENDPCVKKVKKMPEAKT